MDAFVEEFGVKQSMGEVKANFVHDVTEIDVEKECREVFNSSQIFNSTHFEGGIANIFKRDVHEDLVETY